MLELVAVEIWAHDLGAAASRRFALLRGFVLERDAKLRAIGDPAVVCQMDVLCDDLGDPEIAERGPCRIEGHRCGVLPGLRTRADDVGHSVDAHATLLAKSNGHASRDSPTGAMLLPTRARLAGLPGRRHGLDELVHPAVQDVRW